MNSGSSSQSLLEPRGTETGTVPRIETYGRMALSHTHLSSHPRLIDIIAVVPSLEIMLVHLCLRSNINHHLTWLWKANMTNACNNECKLLKGFISISVWHVLISTPCAFLQLLYWFCSLEIVLFSLLFYGCVHWESVSVCALWVGLCRSTCSKGMM